MEKQIKDLEKLEKLSKEYKTLEKKIKKIEEQFYDTPCINHRLVVATGYDSNNYFKCLHKDQLFKNSDLNACRLERCPLGTKGG